MQICLLCQFFITLLPNFRNPYTHIPHKQKDSARPFGRVESMSSQFYTSRAEVSEHYDEIRYIQRADEHADPALELSADERRDHGCGADHEAGRNIQQHALIFDAQERNAAMIGIRNRPMVARISALEKSKFQIFQSGIEPRFIPRKL